jgi:hypothetical protein
LKQRPSGYEAVTLPLLLPLDRKPLSDEGLQLHGRWLLPLENRLDNVGCEQSEAQDVRHIGRVHVLGHGQLIGG